MYYTNPDVKHLVRIFDANERTGYLRLDLNENPGGLPHDFITSVLQQVTPEFVAQYPETAPFTRELAKYLGIKAENLCLVNGSAEGIRYVIQAFTSHNGRIVGVVPSYFMFQVYSQMYGRKFVPVAYNNDLSMNVNNIIDALTPETELLILLNPNNPMGNVYSEEELGLILAAARKNQITVLIDEAYHYFHPTTFLKYALDNKRVFITRTFSKFFSMAGARLGYVVGNPDDIALVQKMTTPHNTNAFALLLGQHAIRNPQLIEKLHHDFDEGRAYLISELDKHNYRHKGEAGNFIFIKPKTDACKIVQRMKSDKRILIKSYDNVGEFGTCLRVSIGAKEYMHQFLDALIALDC